MTIEIKEFNFEGYNIIKISKGGDAIYEYTMQNLPAFKKERNAPGITHLAPHILVLTKYAEFGGNRITYFNTLADQYAWYRQLLQETDNVIAPVKTVAEEITKGINSDINKVKTVFKWVQENIRYIAFEDGIAGFKPDKSQEVLRKKYGDCKGMANLTTQMLRTLNMDARMCWLGTKHIAYNYSTPSLSVDNHCIAAWFYNGKTYFLDATEKYIGFNEVAERIQGRQVLIEDGEKYILREVPVADPLQNTCIEKSKLKMEGNSLTGIVTQTWKGESKEWLLSHLNCIKKEKQEEALKQYLKDDNNNYQIINLKIINLTNYNEDVKIEYDVVISNAVASFDKGVYVDIDNRKEYSSLKIDIEKRPFPYEFAYKDHIIYEVELQLPTGSKAAPFPTELSVENSSFSFKGGYTADKSTIFYKKEIT